MGSPVVVVIPCYRGPIEEVELSLASALEVADTAIIVDDGADQRELDSLAGDRVRIVRRAENGGPAAALDDGIAAAPEGAVICRLDVRDTFYADAKRRQIETVLRGECRASASPHFDPVAGRAHVPHAKWATLIYRDSQFTQMATVFRRSVWAEVGIDRSYRWSEDWRFNLLVQHYIGWQMFPEVTCSAGMFPGGHSDTGGRARDADRKRVLHLGQVLGKPEKYAHFYNPIWCAKRGIAPLQRKA